MKFVATFTDQEWVHAEEIANAFVAHYGVDVDKFTPIVVGQEEYEKVQIMVTYKAPAPINYNLSLLIELAKGEEVE